MSAVNDLIGELCKRGVGVGAEWVSTGGGCMAVAINFGEVLPVGGTRYEILITDREDVFTRGDYASDDDVTGFYAGFYVYDDEWERVAEGITLYLTGEDAGGSPRTAREAAEDGEDPVEVTDFAAEVLAVADAVQFVVQKVEEAETGRCV